MPQTGGFINDLEAYPKDGPSRTLACPVVKGGSAEGDPSGDRRRRLTGGRIRARGVRPRGIPGVGGQTVMAARAVTAALNDPVAEVGIGRASAGGNG